MGALAVTVATHVPDACKTLVEQAAVTGVEAALARGRAADIRSALSRVDNEKGNTQRVTQFSRDQLFCDSLVACTIFG